MFFTLTLVLSPAMLRYYLKKRFLENRERATISYNLKAKHSKALPACPVLGRDRGGRQGT